MKPFDPAALAAVASLAGLALAWPAPPPPPTGPAPPDAAPERRAAAAQEFIAGASQHEYNKDIHHVMHSGFTLTNTYGFNNDDVKASSFTEKDT